MNWCILRTSARSTLRLVCDLKGLGHTAWTPTAVIRKRVARSRDRIEVDAPIAPSFVFADAGRLTDLHDLSRQPIKGCADFSLFRHGGRIPLIADRALQGLRDEQDRLERANAAERRAAMRGQRGEPFTTGERVRMPSGSFAGLEGVIQASDGRHTLVCFGGLMSVQIDTFILREDVANVRQPVAGIAA